MATSRKRPQGEFEDSGGAAGPQTLTLDSLVGGYNGYTSPTLLSPQFWAKSSQVYAGQFGSIRRTRWAPFLNSTASGIVANGFRILSMFSFLDIPNSVNWIMYDNVDDSAKGPRWLIQDPLSPFPWFDGASPMQVNPVLNIYEVTFALHPLFPLSMSLLNGPYMRTEINNFILEANGLFRSKVVVGSVIPNNAEGNPLLEYWGIDAPDVSPSDTLSSGSTKTITTAVRANNIVTITTSAAHGLVVGDWVGISGVADTTFNSGAGVAFQILTVPSPTTFTYAQIGMAASSTGGTVTFGITKTVGRSYQYAWENANTGQVSAPSPASAYVKYASQVGTLDFLETGTISGSGTTVTGTGTSFSTAWIGKYLWFETSVAGVGISAFISAVASPTSLTVDPFPGIVPLNSRFQVLDCQVTHIRIYATADAGAVYFLIARNVINLVSGQSASLAGLEFVDTANSEPPNAPFSSEITQIYNVPPPIGQFVDQYQGRPIVYGVPGALQTFFYGNIEATTVGVPAESFSPLNTVTLPIGDGALNGSSNLPTGFILWSNRQDMFKLTGLLSDNTIGTAAQLGATIQRLPYKIGCASPYATVVTPLGALWLSTDREIWLFTDHYAPKNVGKPVQDVLNRINGTRMPFAKMTYYKRGDRSWLVLAVALDSSTFNNKLLILDLDLLASNGQPSYFTFDMATNAPTWYQFDVNCEGLVTSYDQNSINHLFVGDVDLVTDVDWQPGYYTIGAEQSIPNAGNTLHAFGNDAPHLIKTVEWMRAMTNHLPINFVAQGWRFGIIAYDDDKYIIGLNGKETLCSPGVDNPTNPLFLEYSPAKFRFGGVRPVKGRRFQIETFFPSGPGFYELRGFEVAYTNVVSR